MTKLIPILSGRCLVVELPEGAHSPVVDDYLLGFNLPAPKWAGDWSDDSYDTIELPPGNWRIIGMLSEVTEEDAAEIVGPNGNGDYRNYVGAWGGFATAIQSLDSAILAEGFTFQNNLRNPDDVCYFSRNRMIDDVREYHEVQSRVLDRSRCLLLGRED